MTAAAVIETVREAREVVANLARALSLAASIDVVLVRRLRRRLFETADASTEVDLWTSPLVQMRTGREIVLREDVQSAFWQELRDDRAELERCWRALEDERPRGRPLRRIEEVLTYLAIKGDAAEIQQELGVVVKAMLDEPDRRRDLSAWAARVLARLPADVRECEAGRTLGTAAAGWVATPEPISNLARTPETVKLAYQLRADDKRVPIAIRRVGDTLELGPSLPSPTVSIEVSSNSPLVIIDEQFTHRIALGKTTRIPVKRADVIVGTPDGRRWLLSPTPPEPDREAILSLNGGSGAAYLVAPTLAVTSPRNVARSDGPWTGALAFGKDVIEARVVAVDENADIALLRLDRKAPVDGLELQLDPRTGAMWQAISTPSGGASERGSVPVGSRARWTGTVARSGTDLGIRYRGDEVPERFLRPGLPIFVGNRVIGHVRGDRPREGIIAATPARLVQWWIEQVGPTVVPRFFLYAGDEKQLEQLRSEARRTGVIVERFAIGTVREKDVEAAKMASATIGAIDVEVTAEVRALASRLGVTIRLSSLEETLDAFDRTRQQHAAAQKTAPTIQSSSLASVWIQSARNEDTPANLTFEGASGDIQKGDFVLVFAGDGGRRWPAALYAVTGGRRAQLTSSSSADVTCELLLRLPRPAGELMSRYADEIRALADVTFQRDTRNLNIHDRLVELVWRLNEGTVEGEQITAYLGARRASLATLRTLPVYIHVPERISTSGLLGTSIVHADDVRRFSGHRWCDHEVTIVSGTETVPPEALRVAIRDNESDVLTLEVRATARAHDPAKEPFFAACRGVFPLDVVSASLANDSAMPSSRFDLDVDIQRNSKLPPAASYRRGIQLLIEALANLDARGTTTPYVLHATSSLGGLDLSDVQERVGTNTQVLWIDPEADLVKLRIGEPLEDPRLLLQAALGVQVDKLQAVQTDGFLERFGSWPSRRGRVLSVEAENDQLVATVRGHRTLPVLGYVTFYVAFPTRVDMAVQPRRVRANDGIARLEVEHTLASPVAVGAVIEDEGIVLAAMSEPPGRRAT